ncbi:MAG: FlgD immunoglobulin-like domain containing protein, partial [candidate division WOR-3 bacterium]
VITVHGDYKYEADETFFVDLTNANNASISDSQGLGTILNDDTVYTLTINIVGNGTVSKNPDLPYYEFGTWVYLQASPDPGWGFVGYSGDLSGSNAYDSIYIDADKNVTATFGQVIRDLEVYDIILPSDDTTVTVCTPFQPKVDIKNNTVPAIAELCTVEVHIWGYRIQMDSFCSVSINPNDSVLLYADTVITSVDPGHNLITMTKSWHPYTADITWIANPTHHTVHARVKMADDAVPANDFRQEAFIVNGQNRDLQMNYVGLLKGKEVVRNDTIFMNNAYNTVSVIANPMGPNAAVRIFYKIIKVNSNITLYSRYLDKTILAGSYMCLAFQTGWVPPDTGWYKLISYIVARSGVDVNSRNDTVIRYIYARRQTLLVNNSNVLNSAQSKLATILPTTFALQQNYPNPLRNRTTIQWQIPIASKVTLSIYDATGRTIKILVNNTFAPGYYTITWDGTDNNNQKVPAGIYFYEMQTDKFTARRKLIITN